MNPSSATLRELAGLLGAELHGDPGLRVSRVAELAEAGPDALAPFTDPSRLDEALRCGAAALLVSRHHPALPQPQLVCADPRRALAGLLVRFGAAAGADPDAGSASGGAAERERVRRHLERYDRLYCAPTDDARFGWSVVARFAVATTCRSELRRTLAAAMRPESEAP